MTKIGTGGEPRWFVIAQVLLLAAALVFVLVVIGLIAGGAS